MVISPQLTCKIQNTWQCQFEKSKRYKSTRYSKIKLLFLFLRNENYKTCLNLCSNRFKPATTFKKLMAAAAQNPHPDIWLVRHYTLKTGKNWTAYIRTSRSSHKPWKPEIQDQKLLNTHTGKHMLFKIYYVNLNMLSNLIVIMHNSTGKTLIVRPCQSEICKIFKPTHYPKTKIRSLSLRKIAGTGKKSSETGKISTGIGNKSTRSF